MNDAWGGAWADSWAVGAWGAGQEVVPDTIQIDSVSRGGYTVNFDRTSARNWEKEEAERIAARIRAAQEQFRASQAVNAAAMRPAPRAYIEAVLPLPKRAENDDAESLALMMLLLEAA